MDILEKACFEHKSEARERLNNIPKLKEILEYIYYNNL